ncbi:hypothetical protein WJ0W_001090 [Paenibacillus melissococcoides]|uniref:Uncharacterized protein n=1 Tax=Paenibacillus melissococcoides TaxID=2912268 RepID=A0ABN8TYL4_9BACL|nr:hypothetical protein [Paenibacillus melissococcoides]CAH8243851.1 hypothetical protein WJ0W_001090 [Paenibacillus melissococcoides]CAH8707179.1 hypothetical protein WDD9_001526 [Paenibacillus melissococcoides]
MTALAEAATIEWTEEPQQGASLLLRFFLRIGGGGALERSFYGILREMTLRKKRMYVRKKAWQTDRKTV